MPLYNKERARFETSTYRTDGLQPQDIWLLGYEYVEDLTNQRRIKARGDGIAALVMTFGTSV
jgi:hypothetical protein